MYTRTTKLATSATRSVRDGRDLTAGQALAQITKYPAGSGYYTEARSSLQHHHRAAHNCGGEQTIETLVAWAAGLPAEK